MTGMDDLVKTWTAQQLRIDADLIESDFALILGRRIRWPDWMLKRLRLEIVRQKAPGAVIEQYRGIRRRDRFIIDHFPKWPTPEEKK